MKNDLEKECKKLVKKIRKFNTEEELDYKYYFLIYNDDFKTFRIKGNKYIFNEFGYFKDEKTIIEIIDKYGQEIRKLYD